jgi:hypothetical protein
VRVFAVTNPYFRYKGCRVPTSSSGVTRVGQHKAPVSSFPTESDSKQPTRILQYTAGPIYFFAETTLFSRLQPTKVAPKRRPPKRLSKSMFDVSFERHQNRDPNRQAVSLRFSLASSISLIYSSIQVVEIPGSLQSRHCLPLLLLSTPRCGLARYQ